MSSPTSLVSRGLPLQGFVLPAFVDVGWLGYSNDRWRFDGLFGELSLVSGRLRLLTPVFRRVSNPESVDSVLGDLSDLQGFVLNLCNVLSLQDCSDIRRTNPWDKRRFDGVVVLPVDCF